MSGEEVDLLALREIEICAEALDNTSRIRLFSMLMVLVFHSSLVDVPFVNGEISMRERDKSLSEISEKSFITDNSNFTRFAIHSCSLCELNESHLRL